MTCTNCLKNPFFIVLMIFTVLALIFAYNSSKHGNDSFYIGPSYIRDFGPPYSTVSMAYPTGVLPAGKNPGSKHLQCLKQNPEYQSYRNCMIN